MLETQKIKRIMVTLLKGSPIIVICLMIGLYIAKIAVNYSNPKFQSIAKIKLDDLKYGMSGNNLYQDFDVFSSENKIETEAEILHSPMIIGKTIEKLDLTYQIWRKGTIKSTLLHAENPFIIEHDSLFDLYDQKIIVRVNDDDIFLKNSETTETISSGKLNSNINIGNGSIKISLNKAVLEDKQLDINGEYELNFLSKAAYISEIQQNLDVKAVDKEIAVLRVVFKSEDPHFAALFTNALCETYIEDYISNKSLAAEKTLQFIDERMSAINDNLEVSENKLEDYKIDHDVVNTLQETETGLREISKLRIQLINLEMEEKATFELETYIRNGDYYENTAINFGFGDLVLTELVKKLKLYTDEKKDLQLKYTDEDERIINIQSKIDDVEAYIKEAVSRNLANIEIKRQEIENALVILENQFNDIPTREKEMHILEREFLNNETVYNFLFQKKLEAQIASNAQISFHRIIQPAEVSSKPISPNKVLITFVSGFLSLIIGIIIVFGRKIVSGRIIAKADIEKLTSTPVIAALKENNSETSDIPSLAAAILSKNNVEPRTILITSSIRHEGKSYLTKKLKTSFHQMGYSVAMLCMNMHDAEATDLFFSNLLSTDKREKISGNSVTIGFSKKTLNSSFILAHKRFDSLMNQIKSQFDIVIIDTPGSVISSDAMHLIKYADMGLYLVRSKVSKAQYIRNVDILQSETNFNNMNIVLNGVHHTTNFSGTFNGSKLNYKGRPKGLFKLIKHYFKMYIKQ